MTKDELIARMKAGASLTWEDEDYSLIMPDGEELEVPHNLGEAVRNGELVKTIHIDRQELVDWINEAPKEMGEIRQFLEHMLTAPPFMRLPNDVLRMFLLIYGYAGIEGGASKESFQMTAQTLIEHLGKIHGNVGEGRIVVGSPTEVFMKMAKAAFEGEVCETCPEKDDCKEGDEPCH